MAKTLKIEYSCEIGNLIDVMAEVMGKTTDAVETMASKEYLYPEGTKTFVTTQFGKDDDDADGTLRGALFDFMVEQGIKSLYITEAI